MSYVASLNPTIPKGEVRLRWQMPAGWDNRRTDAAAYKHESRGGYLPLLEILVIRLVRMTLRRKMDSAMCLAERNAKVCPLLLGVCSFLC